MILSRFAKLLPGKTYKKKLFYWNLIQYVFMWVCIIIFSPFQSNPIMWWIYITTAEFFTNDGHVYGDFGYIFTGMEIRGIIWVFSILAMVVLSYLWAYRNSNIAKYLRTTSYLITLISYIIWTLFFTWREDYDYGVWAKIIVAYNYNPLVILMAITSLSAMWFGVVISNGYLIYKGWKEG
jgi:hypothetical protein